MILLSYRAQKKYKPGKTVKIAPGIYDLAPVILNERPDSLPKAILDTMDTFRNVEDFLFVEPGAAIRENPKLLLDVKTFEVAAYVDKLGRCPAPPSRFDGVGRVGILTLFFRSTNGGRRVLARWAERLRLRGTGCPAEDLLYTLAEMKDVPFCYLPQTYSWVESTMRAFQTDAQPVIEHHRAVHAPPPPARSPREPASKPKPRPPEVLWVGHLYQYTGYGKANREILFRVANTINVRIDDAHLEPVYVDKALQVRLDAHKQVLVGPRAPLLRFMGPDHIAAGDRHRIVWTMMETSERVHPDMIARANKNFDELWTPTFWNLDVFRASGLRIPSRTMPLGVDTVMFQPRKRRKFPECRLASTGRRGLVARPDGFTALTIGLPGFRKGWDVIADAFESIFARNRSAHLVIGVTHAPAAWKEKVYRQFARYRANIWTLEGSFDESELAGIYSASDVYVSASRGEGFNMPALEATACGIPVVLPMNSAHPEVFPHAFFFNGEGTKTYPEGDWISDWYRGMLFTKFGRKSRASLAEILYDLSKGKNLDNRTMRARNTVIENFTWDIAAMNVSRRLLEVQPT